MPATPKSSTSRAGFRSRTYLVRRFASEFAAEGPPGNDPTLTVSGVDPEGAVSERERGQAATAGVVAGDEVGDLLAGHLTRDQPGRRGPQVARRRVHDHRHPAHREGRRDGGV